MIKQLMKNMQRPSDQQVDQGRTKSEQDVRKMSGEENLKKPVDLSRTKTMTNEPTKLNIAIEETSG
jgi:hypothetical protein